MEHRYLKAAVTLSVALLALFYVAHNLANWSAAHQAIGYVLSHQDHVIYPNNLAPAIGNPALISAVLLAICAGEAAAGGFALVGAFRIWSARKSDAATFSAAKRFAVIGSGLAVLVWFLLFAVIGGALHQMWQTEIGSGSLVGAFQYAGLSFFSLIYLALPEAELR
jgi:predicted small integral membrane protein